MKTKILSLALMLFGLIGSNSCAQQNDSINAESVLANSLALDTSFIEFSKVEDKIVDNQINNIHDHKHINWSLIEDKNEQAKCKTQEDMKLLLIKAGMKEVDTYLTLKSKYMFYSALLFESYPQLVDLPNNERFEIFQQAKQRIVKTKKS